MKSKNSSSCSHHLELRNYFWVIFFEGPFDVPGCDHSAEPAKSWVVPDSTNPNRSSPDPTSYRNSFASSLQLVRETIREIMMLKWLMMRSLIYKFIKDIKNDDSDRNY